MSAGTIIFLAAFFGLPILLLAVHVWELYDVGKEIDRRNEDLNQ